MNHEQVGWLAQQQLHSQLGSAQNMLGWAQQQMGQAQARMAQRYSNGYINPGYTTAGEQLNGLSQKSKYAVTCKNCHNQYDMRSFIACPSCGVPAPKQKEKMDEQGNYYVPELAEYEKRVAHLNRARVEAMEDAARGKERKGMFGLFVKRKELQLEIQKLKDEVDYHKRQEEMRIAEAVQKQRLATNEEVAKVKLDKESSIKKLVAEHEVELTKIRGARAEELSGLQADFATKIADVKAKAAEEHFEKLSAALLKLHSEGDKNTKFVQELALGLVQKTPKMLPTHAEVHLTGEAKDVLGDQA